MWHASSVLRECTNTRGCTCNFQFLSNKRGKTVESLNVLTRARDVKDDNGGSVSREPYSVVVPKGLTQYISSLFDIGQHITLCLNNGGSTSDINSLYSDIYAYIENHVREAREATRKKKVLREKEQRI